MLFGSRDRFAIESMTEPYLCAPSQVWGRMRIWCDGTEIGDYSNEHCGLFDAYDGFSELRELLARNWISEFNGLSDKDLWNLLDGALYGYHGDVASQQTDYFLAMTLTATKSNWVKEDHWRESHLVADNGRLIWHQYMESSS